MDEPSARLINFALDAESPEDWTRPPDTQDYGTLVASDLFANPDRGRQAAESLLKGNTERLIEVAGALVDFGAPEAISEAFPDQLLAFVTDELANLHDDHRAGSSAAALRKALLTHTATEWAPVLRSLISQFSAVESYKMTAHVKLSHLAASLFDLTRAMVPMADHQRYRGLCIDEIDGRFASGQLDVLRDLGPLGPGLDPTPLLALLQGDDVFTLRTRAMVFAKCELWEDMLSTVAGSDDRFARLFELAALMELNQVEELVNRTAALYVENVEVAHRLPIPRLVQILEEDEFGPSVASAIVYGMYARFVGPGKTEHLSEIVEDTLNAFGVSRPSELADSQDIASRPELSHFLREVCVPVVLDWLVTFTGTEDIQSERIKILQTLKGLDDSRAEAYNREIKALTRAQQIVQGMTAPSAGPFRAERLARELRLANPVHAIDAAPTLGGYAR